MLPARKVARAAALDGRRQAEPPQPLAKQALRRGVHPPVRPLELLAEPIVGDTEHAQQQVKIPTTMYSGTQITNAE